MHTFFAVAPLGTRAFKWGDSTRVTASLVSACEAQAFVYCADCIPGFTLGQAVAPGEVAAAIRDMLAAADLPLGLEQERLLEESLSLQQQLKATQAALDHQQSVLLRDPVPSLPSRVLHMAGPYLMHVSMLF